VGRSKEVELVVSALSLGEGSEEGSSSSSGEEGGELEDVATREGRGRGGRQRSARRGRKEESENERTMAHLEFRGLTDLQQAD